ncbi:MAG: PD-(D/E)XK nuclease family protein [Gemmataceae bacterium]
MSDRLTASAVKLFFQYRCDRQVRYNLLAPPERISLQIAQADESDEPWALAGLQFEADLVASLASSAKVLAPPMGERWLTTDETLAFLRRQSPHEYAHQARLWLPDPAPFRKQFGLDESLQLAAGYPDLLRCIVGTGGTAFRVIDVKAVEVPTVFHKAQVAYYALVLAELLRQIGSPFAVDLTGEIWHHPPGRDTTTQVTPFRLKAYEAQVGDFLRDHLRRILGAKLDATTDETAFHLGYKCEQCDYLPHCIGAADENAPPAGWDVSAVPGLSPVGKQTLRNLGIRTVGELAAAGSAVAAPSNGWKLRTNGPLLTLRATALADGLPRRLPEYSTCLMPPRIDAAVFLLCDRDPVEGRLATIGALFEIGTQRNFVTVVVDRSGAEPERDALLTVLLATIEFLDAVDRHNATHPNSPQIAHLFVYEPSEAVDLQDAIGRHLTNEAVRSGLLNLVRMFPPEPLIPDPEYRGRRHLPATAVRSVFDALFALPARVTHDLARVCAALGNALPPATAYRPTRPFARPFSSRLNIDVCRALKTGQIAPQEVDTDLRARLTAVSELVRWLITDNAKAMPQYLRLKKDPFRWQGTFDPLTANDLEFLLAQEILAARAAELGVLTELALPPQSRKQKFKCIGPMRLTNESSSPFSWAGVRLTFESPADCEQAELGPRSFNLLLTDNDPDLLLDPTAWPLVSVSAAEFNPSAEGMKLVLDVRRKVWGQGPLKARLADHNDGWWLDAGYGDVNTDRMQNFLTYLDSGGT